MGQRPTKNRSKRASLRGRAESGRATPVVAGSGGGALQRTALAKNAAGFEAEGGGLALGDVGGAAHREGLTNRCVYGAITRADAKRLAVGAWDADQAAFASRGFGLGGICAAHCAKVEWSDWAGGAANFRRSGRTATDVICKSAICIAVAFEIHANTRRSGRKRDRLARQIGVMGASIGRTDAAWAMAALTKRAKVDAQLRTRTQDFLTENQTRGITLFAFVALLGSGAGFGLRIADEFLVGVAEFGRFCGVGWDITSRAGLRLDGGGLAKAAGGAAIEGRVIETTRLEFGFLTAIFGGFGVFEADAQRGRQWGATGAAIGVAQAAEKIVAAALEAKLVLGRVIVIGFEAQEARSALCVCLTLLTCASFAIGGAGAASFGGTADAITALIGAGAAIFRTRCAGFTRFALCIAALGRTSTTVFFARGAGFARFALSVAALDRAGAAIIRAIAACFVCVADLVSAFGFAFSAIRSAVVASFSRFAFGISAVGGAGSAVLGAGLTVFVCVADFVSAVGGAFSAIIGAVVAVFADSTGLVATGGRAGAAVLGTSFTIFVLFALSIAASRGAGAAVTGARSAGFGILADLVAAFGLACAAVGFASGAVFALFALAIAAGSGAFSAILGAIFAVFVVLADRVATIVRAFSAILGAGLAIFGYLALCVSTGGCALSAVGFARSAIFVLFAYCISALFFADPAVIGASFASFGALADLVVAGLCARTAV